MANHELSFKELLDAAPLTTTDSFTLTGLLARLPDSRKFALTLNSGKTVTLDVDAVKAHRAVLGGPGQTTVEIQIHPEKVSADVLEAAKADIAPGRSLPSDAPKPLSDGSFAFWDVPRMKPPFLDRKHPFLEHTYPFNDGFETPAGLDL